MSDASDLLAAGAAIAAFAILSTQSKKVTKDQPTDAYSGGAAPSPATVTASDITPNEESEIQADALRRTGQPLPVITQGDVDNLRVRQQTQAFRMEQELIMRDRLEGQQQDIGARLAKTLRAGASYRGKASDTLISTVKDETGVRVYEQKAGQEAVFIGWKEGTMTNKALTTPIQPQLSSSQKAAKAEATAARTKALTGPKVSAKGKYKAV